MLRLPRQGTGDQNEGIARTATDFLGRGMASERLLDLLDDPRRFGRGDIELRRCALMGRKGVSNKSPLPFPDSTG